MTVRHWFFLLIPVVILLVIAGLVCDVAGQEGYTHHNQTQPQPPQVYRHYYATPIRDLLFGRYRIVYPPEPPRYVQPPAYYVPRWERVQPPGYWVQPPARIYRGW